ncbi:MAG: hypothetical protein AB7G93_15985 [Bdellovibrionales bacterium]
MQPTPYLQQTLKSGKSRRAPYTICISHRNARCVPEEPATKMKAFFPEGAICKKKQIWMKKNQEKELGPVEKFVEKFAQTHALFPL